MPPRKSTAAATSAVTVEVVPVDPDAGITFADHRAASAMMLRALAGLDAATALERLRTLYGSLPNGTARRAVLAARLTILRDDLRERVRPAAPPVATPAVIKAPLKAGALSTLALDAAAKLLFDADAGADEEEPPPKTSKAAPPVADLFAALAAADDEDAEVESAKTIQTSPNVAAALVDTVFPDFASDRLVSEGEAAEAGFADPATEPDLDAKLAAKRSNAKAKPRKAKSATMDPAEIGALMELEDIAAVRMEPENASAFVPIPPAAMASALSVLSALEETAEETPPPNTTSVPYPAPNLASGVGAAFAALGESDDPPVSLFDDGALVGPLAATEAVEDVPKAPTTPEPIKATALGLTADAAFDTPQALMDAPDAIISTSMADANADALQREVLDQSEEAVPQGTKPRRKKPTNLSDVSAAFAAMNSDGAE